MAEHPSKPDIESIEQEFTFQQREWVWQRMGWVILLLIIIAAMLGLTGKGSILHLDRITTSSTDGALSVTHEMFLRRQSSDKLIFSVPGVDSERFTISISEAFISEVHIEKIIPEPESQTVTPFGIEYTFSSLDRKSDAKIYFYFKPMQMGSITADFLAHTGSKASFETFVYP